MKIPRFTEKQKKDMTKIARENVIAHWASNADMDKETKVFTAGKGCYIYDMLGNKYLDTFASLLTSTLGHGREEMKEAAIEQFDKIAFFPNYHDTFTEPLLKLAEKIAEIMPGELEVSFFVNSGTEANETALRMARQYHYMNGQPNRYKVIARKYSYHGTTLAAASYTGFTVLRKYYEPLMPGALFAPSVRCHDCDLGCDKETCNLACLKQMEKMIEFEGSDTISAIIMDPIPGSNIGYPIPPDGYLQGVRELCDKHGIILIFDEVQVGFGKTGKWFACQNWNMEPDIISISKALTAGYLPLGIAVTTKKIAKAFSEPGKEFVSGSTYGGHPVSCAVALKNIEIMQKEDVVGQAAKSGEYLKGQLEKLYKYKIVGAIRGMGMIWAIDLMKDRETGEKLDPKLGVGTAVRDWCWENGMILRNNGDFLVIAPALTITKEEIDIIVANVDKALAHMIEKFRL